MNNIFVICNGILMYGDQVVITAVLTRKIFWDFHAGHLGICRMKALMWSYASWQGMDKDIEDMVRTWKSCALVAKAPPIKFNPWSKTDKPWSRLNIDYSDPIKGTYYFVIVDSFSKWPEVVKFKALTSKNTINMLHELFARFELLETIVSDNAMQFSSKEFENFCKMLLINHLCAKIKWIGWKIYQRIQKSNQKGKWNGSVKWRITKILIDLSNNAECKC